MHKSMEKKSYDIIFNLKNNPSVSLREINKLLVDIRKNTQEMATDVSRQISAVQSPVDDLRTKWLGLAGGIRKCIRNNINEKRFKNFTDFC